MTFILGMNCFDGIVLAADSLEEDGINKRIVDKLSWYEGKENSWGIAYGCAGNGPVISVFEEKVQELFLGTSILAELYSRGSIQEQFEAAMTYVYQKHPNEQLDVIAGVWGSKPIDKAVFHARYRSDCLEIVKTYGIAGMDGSLANTLLSSMFIPSMNVDEALPLAVFVTAIMKQKAAGVGGSTKVMSHKIGENGWEWHEPHKIVGLEARYPVDDFYDYLLHYWAEKNPEIKRPLDRFPYEE